MPGSFVGMGVLGGDDDFCAGGDGGWDAWVPCGDGGWARGGCCARSGQYGVGLHPSPFPKPRAGHSVPRSILQAREAGGDMTFTPRVRPMGCRGKGHPLCDAAMLPGLCLSFPDCKWWGGLVRSMSSLSPCPNERLTPSLKPLLLPLSPQLPPCSPPPPPPSFPTPSLSPLRLQVSFPHHRQLKSGCPSTSPCSRQPHSPPVTASPGSVLPRYRGQDPLPVPARDALVSPLPDAEARGWHRRILHHRCLLLLGLIANLIFGFLPKPRSWDHKNPCSRVRASLFTAAS